MGKISNFRDLHIYQNALEAAMDIFEITKSFPKEERFSIVDQIRRSSRSVCANIAEAWRKRRYRAAFIAKLNDAETEACETQVHLEISFRCNYLPTAGSTRLGPQIRDYHGANSSDDPRAGEVAG